MSLSTHFLLELYVIKLWEGFMFVPVHVHDNCTQAFVCRLSLNNEDNAL